MSKPTMIWPRTLAKHSVAQIIIVKFILMEGDKNHQTIFQGIHISLKYIIKKKSCVRLENEIFSKDSDRRCNPLLLVFLVKWSNFRQYDREDDNIDIAYSNHTVENCHCNFQDTYQDHSKYIEYITRNT